MLIECVVVFETLLKQIVLFNRWQLSIDQQELHLDEGRFRGQLLDRVPTILQDPFVTVDEGDA